MILSLLAFGPMSYSEVTFTSYVKKNHKLLKSTEKKQETIAFQEKKMYRSVASVPTEEKEKTEPPITNVTPTDPNQQEQTTDSNASRPNQ